MSVTDQIRDKKNKTNGKTPKKPESAFRFVSFHPTKEDKELIRTGEVPLDECVLMLERKLEQDLALSIKRMYERDAFCMTLRQDVSYGSPGVALSVYHSDLQTLFMLMSRALETKFPDFPENVQLELPFTDTDW